MYIHHGVKLEKPVNTNLVMIKQSPVYGLEALPVFESENSCNVISVVKQHPQTNSLQSNTVYQDYIIKHTLNDSPSKYCIQNSRMRKLEMEEFKDLSPYLPNMITNSLSPIVDELNTPVFDKKEPFDFSLPCHPNNNNNDEDWLFTVNGIDNYKIKTEQPDFNYNLNDANLLDGFFHISGDLNIKMDNSSDTDMVDMDNSLKSPCTLDINETNTNVINSLEQVTYNEEAEENLEYVKMANTFNGNLFDDNIIMDGIFEITPMVQPDGQDCLTENISSSSPNTNFGLNRFPKRLELNCTGKIIENSDLLDTPDIIKTITDIENDSFNILDIVSDKDISSFSTEDLQLNIPLKIESNGCSPSQFQRNKPRSKKLNRKRKINDDEDYIPPGKVGRKNISILSTSRTSEYSGDSSSEDDNETRPKKRGRTANRTPSVSSDSSKNSLVDRYRELRDKNNEASRRSRFKRKQKENVLEKEADELVTTNIKLKADVEHLEKTVANFRNNLFKIMLKK